MPHRARLEIPLTSPFRYVEYLIVEYIFFPIDFGSQSLDLSCQTSFQAYALEGLTEKDDAIKERPL